MAPTTITSGTLVAGAADIIPSMSDVSAASGTTFVLNGFDQSIGSINGAGTVTDNSATSAELTVGNDLSCSSTFSGIICNGTGTTTGVLTLVTAADATIELIGTGDPPPLPSIIIQDGATVKVNGFFDARNPLEFGCGGGTLQFASSGSLHLDQNVQIDPGVTATINVLGRSDGSTNMAMIYGNITGATGHLDVISSSGEAGTGILILGGDNTYGGGTTITDNGSVYLASISIGVIRGELVVNEGGYLNLGGQNVTVGSLSALAIAQVPLGVLTPALPPEPPR